MSVEWFDRGDGKGRKSLLRALILTAIVAGVSAIFGAWGHAVGNHTAPFVLGFFQSRIATTPQSVAEYPVEIVRPLTGQETRIAAGRRYKVSLNTMEKRNISMKAGSISVWYDGHQMIRDCSTADFEFLQYFDHYELVSCAAVSTFTTERTR